MPQSDEAQSQASYAPALGPRGEEPIAASDFVAAYHQETKHSFQRYARSSGYLDWATQPDPFRRYHGAALVPLRFSRSDASPSYDDLFVPGAVPSQPVDSGTLSEFFEFSLALSAWKQDEGSRWALRINPSSGNLHPTEGYLVIGPVEGLHDRPGVYHYAPKEHALERREEFSTQAWDTLVEGFPLGTFLAALTSIHWREAWKYGERAYRYCQHDAGHALAALTVSAALQGWSASLLQTWSDADIAALLGLDRAEEFADAEREQPDLLIAVIPTDSEPRAEPVPTKSGARANSTPPENAFQTVRRSKVNLEAIAAIARGPWSGRANRLSEDHVEWRLIDAVAEACAKPTTEPPAAVEIDSWGPPLPPHRPPGSARNIIRQRRSAVAFDGVTSLPAAPFYLMLDRVLPRPDRMPWSTFGSPACVHLALFVHGVVGLDAGLYFLLRRRDKLTDLRAATDPTFHWSKPDGCPDSLPLYLLTPGDARQVARQLSCGQDIAADSAFSLGMIAEFEEPLKKHGAWFYRRLFWETGVIGQILYLEAEAAGLRATGIGCFFDDPVHELLCLKGMDYQSLYHFTIGGPVEDTRLTTLPPYPKNV